MVSAIWLVVAAGVGLCLGMVLFAVLTVAAEHDVERMDEAHLPRPM